MPLYKFDPGGLSLIRPTTFAAAGIRERTHLQALLREQIHVVAPDTLVIAEEFGDWDSSQRRIDLLAIDREANLVVVELKRDETGSHMELQALRYAAMVARITFDQAVTAYQEFLFKLGSDSDARANLLEFLEWDEPDESAFAQDVRIVLVAAGFSRELTSSVMWLNERDLDIRCVQLLPHGYRDDLLLHVQQVIPLPEAGEYQVQIREKARRERAERTADTRDLTRYDIVIYGSSHVALRKRRAVLQIVKELCENGIRPEQIMPHLKRTRPFVHFEGDLDRVSFLERLEAGAQQGSGPDGRNYLTGEDELIRLNGHTYALSKRWGTNTIPTLDALKHAFPEAGIEFRAVPSDAAEPVDIA